jgi:hypothetical protein
VILPYYLFHVKKCVCFSHVVSVTGAAWPVAMRIEVGLGDLVQRTEDGQAQVGYSLVGRSRGWVTLCAVCTVHKETRSAGFWI